MAMATPFSDPVPQRSLRGGPTSARCWTAARGRPRGREPVAGPAGRGRDREDGAAEYLVAAAPDRRSRGRSGVESEMELAFAGLHQLCAPLLDRLDAAARAAARGARDRVRPAAPARRRTGSSSGWRCSSLLSEVAEERPLLCVVDDAQWLDQASAPDARLRRPPPAGGAGRRSCSPPREPRRGDARGLPELEVDGLRDADARALLGSAVAVHARRARPRPDRRRDARQPAGAAGAAARPDARRSSPAGSGCCGAQALPGRIEESFLRRLEAAARRRRAPAAGRRRRAGRRPARCSGARPSASASPPTPRTGRRTAGLLDDRRAGAVPPPAGPLRALPLGGSRGTPGASTWRSRRRPIGASTPTAGPGTCAAAAAGPDEEVAVELERSAGRAQARGGLAAAAAFLQRAVALTRDPAVAPTARWPRPRPSLQAGAFDAAHGMLATAEAGPLDELQRARLDLLRAQAAFAESRGSDAPAAAPAGREDARAARPAARARDVSRRVELGAVRRPAGDRRQPARGRRARRGRRRDRATAPRPSDLLLDGFALAFTDGRAAAAPVLQRAATGFAGRRRLDRGGPPLGLARDRAAAMVWDYETCRAVADARRPARPRGRRADVLAVSVNVLAQAIVLGGRLRRGRVAGRGGRRGHARRPARHVAPYGAWCSPACRAARPRRPR